MFQRFQSLANDIYSQRVFHLRQTCANNSEGFIGDSSDQDVMHNIHVDKLHNLVYCQIQKVGSTFIRNLLRKVSQQGKISSDNRLQRLTEQTGIGFAELHYAIHQSDKFMFVREPYSRVLSGYVDKLFSPNTQYWKATGSYIVSKIRKNADPLSLRCGHDVTFAEFVRYIIQSEIRIINECFFV